MNFRQFAYRNVVRKKRTYAAHFLSSAFSVMAFFIYAVLLYHPDLQGQLASSSATASYLATMGLKVSQYFIFVFSFLFLLYSAGAFLKARKREFGILLVLGMTEKQRMKLTFAENMLIGLAAVGSGIGLGLLFTKLMLLASAELLMLEEGLRFYLPLQAVWMTAGVFSLLFLAVSILTLRVGRVASPLELIKEDNKPKPEPKASVWLSMLALLLIAAGYGMVFVFVYKRAFFLWLLALAIVCVVIGTYFLFTQFSVFALRALRRKQGLLFRGINLMTLTDMAYRVRDNAVMFFMVATVMAVSFSGIGACLAIGDPERTEKSYPYAFTYQFSGSENEQAEEGRLARIDDALTSAGLAFTKARLEIAAAGDIGVPVVGLTSFNKLAELRGFGPYELGDNELLIASGLVSRNNGVYHDEEMLEQARAMLAKAGEGIVDLRLNGRTNDPVMPVPGDVLVIPDASFGLIRGSAAGDLTDTSVTYYVVPEWEKTLNLARQLEAKLSTDAVMADDAFSALAIDHHRDRQLNGILLIISVLVGVVFFTFAASFIYFRLYADVGRDEKQYGMVGKLGLSRKEMGRLVTRQLSVMFFLPFLIGAAHSAVAFVNMAELTMYSMVSNSLLIYGIFLAIQVLYFLLIRWRYLARMRSRVT